MKIKTFNQAEKYLNSLIKDGSRQLFQGAKGLEKMKYFLSFFDSPQNKIKIIHIAGTAGKGSTCYLISKLLLAHNFKVGLHLSPHLVDIRERFQINNKPISKEEFIFYLNKFIPIINKVERSQYGSLSYFEVLVGMAFYIFYDKKVDYAVIETGLGGLYDATNIIDRNDKLSVITRIDFDHTKILGNTLDKIAYQKAMIINENSFALALDQKPIVKKTILKVAKEKKAILKFIEPINIELSLYGDHQKENATLALEVLKHLSKRDNFQLKMDLVNQVFESVSFPGRFDIKKIKNKTVILDGAHNKIKMSAFTSALQKRYPDKKFNFLIAFKKGKDFKKMLNYIIPLASKITITSFFNDNQNLFHLSLKPEEVAEILNLRNYKNYSIIKKTEKAFIKALEETDDILVITGSLYLLGEIYKIIKC